jgi:hypothetical protein
VNDGMSPRVKGLLKDYLDTMLLLAHRFRHAVPCDNPAVVLLDLTDADAFGVAETILQHDVGAFITKGRGWTRVEWDAKAEALHRLRTAGIPVAMAVSAETAWDLTLCAGPIEPGTFLAIVVAEGNCWNRVIPLHWAEP